MKKYRNHYRLYIDDHGSRNPDHVMVSRDDGMDCFALGGVLVRESDVDDVIGMYKEFAKKWRIMYPLHSTDIRGMRKDFRWLQDSTKNSQRFHSDLNTFLTSVPVLGFAVTVSRPGYNMRYKDRYGNDRWKLCKTAYSILIERVAKYVEAQDATFEIFFEQSGKREDRMIKEYTRTLKKDGQPFNKETSAKYSPYSAQDFKKTILGQPQERTKKCVLTQIADLYLYPMVKRRYEETYKAWVELFDARRIVDAVIEKDSLCKYGLKYSCFDEISHLKSKNSE